MNKITIEGVTTYVSGNNIRVHNRKIYVDDVFIKEVLGSEVKVLFEGDLAKLDATNVTIYGSVHGNVDSTNTTIHGDVGGDVDATNVKCGNIAGKVDATVVKYVK